METLVLLFANYTEIKN